MLFSLCSLRLDSQSWYWGKSRWQLYSGVGKKKGRSWGVRTLTDDGREVVRNAAFPPCEKPRCPLKPWLWPHWLPIFPSVRKNVAELWTPPAKHVLAHARCLTLSYWTLFMFQILTAVSNAVFLPGNGFPPSWKHLRVL